MMLVVRERMGAEVWQGEVSDAAMGLQVGDVLVVPGGRVKVLERVVSTYEAADGVPRELKLAVTGDQL